MNTVDWLKKLISFDTTSSLSNLKLIDYVADYLDSLGLYPHLSYNTEKTKANLFVSLPDQYSSTDGGFVLSGHTDVVPVAGQEWENDPFHATILENRLYGRGSSDMKGFIASALAMIPKTLSLKLNQPIHIALSFDEEVGCLGIPSLFEDLSNRNIKPNYCIVGEPTLMKMVIAHKGNYGFKCSVHGKSVHSSLTPKGVNAIDYAARLISFINQLSESLKERNDQDHAFDVPFSTMNVGMISGGTAVNIVPNLCEFSFEYRNLPHMKVEDILSPIQSYIQNELKPQMQKIDGQTDIVLKPLDSIPPMRETENKEFKALLEKLLGQQESNKVAYATEASLFQEYGIQTVVCGPGNIQQAHQANEFIDLKELDRCDLFLNKLIHL